MVNFFRQDFWNGLVRTEHGYVARVERWLLFARSGPRPQTTTRATLVSRPDYNLPAAPHVWKNLHFLFWEICSRSCVCCTSAWSGQRVIYRGDIKCRHAVFDWTVKLCRLPEKHHHDVFMSHVNDGDKRETNLIRGLFCVSWFLDSRCYLRWQIDHLLSGGEQLEYDALTQKSN